MTQAATLTLYLKHFYTQSSSKTKAISTYPFYSLEQKMILITSPSSTEATVVPSSTQEYFIPEEVPVAQKQEQVENDTFSYNAEAMAETMAVNTTELYNALTRHQDYIEGTKKSPLSFWKTQLSLPRKNT